MKAKGQTKGGWMQQGHRLSVPEGPQRGKQDGALELEENLWRKANHRHARR